MYFKPGQEIETKINSTIDQINDALIFVSQTDEYVEATGNITSTGGDIQSETGDVLSFNKDLNEEISLNDVGYNTQKISYAGGATIVDSDVNINQHNLTNLANPVNNLDAANKQYVDDKILNTYTSGDGISIEDAAGDTKEISVKTTDVNSGLKFDDGGNMSVAVKDKAGINLDNDGLSVNAGNGLEISETGALQVKLKDGEANLIVNDTGLSLSPTLTGLTSVSAGDVTISGSKITGLSTDAITGNTDAVNKEYVDTQIKNVDTATYEAGNGINIADGTISVKTADKNSGLKFEYNFRENSR